MQTPRNHKEALRLPESQMWKEAELREFNAHQVMKTYTLMPLPPGKRAIPTNWVYKVKQTADGEFSSAKARWVVNGSRQKEGIDYSQTYSPVVNLDSIRILISFVLLHNLTLWQLDIDTAYLHGNVDREIYLRQPEGYEDPAHLDWVCKLNTNLYGLKQAAQIWHKVLRDYLLQNNFKEITAAKCTFIYTKDNEIIALAVYVDDIIPGCTKKNYQMLVTILEQRFKIKVLGEAKFILGIQVIQSPRKIILRQTAAIKALLERFGMTDCNPSPTPTTRTDLQDASLMHTGRDQYSTYTMFGREKMTMSDFDYHSAVGMLNYIAMGSRPDLSFAVALAARFVQSPGPQHKKLIKRII
jgi:hypothetical protein